MQRLKFSINDADFHQMVSRDQCRSTESHRTSIIFPPSQQLNCSYHLTHTGHHPITPDIHTWKIETLMSKCCWLTLAQHLTQSSLSTGWRTSLLGFNAHLQLDYGLSDRRSSVSENWQQSFRHHQAASSAASEPAQQGSSGASVP